MAHKPIQLGSVCEPASQFRRVHVQFVVQPEAPNQTAKIRGGKLFKDRNRILQVQMTTKQLIKQMLKAGELTHSYIKLWSIYLNAI